MPYTQKLVTEESWSQGTYSQAHLSLTDIFVVSKNVTHVLCLLPSHLAQEQSKVLSAGKRPRSKISGKAGVRGTILRTPAGTGVSSDVSHSLSQVSCFVTVQSRLLLEETGMKWIFQRRFRTGGKVMALRPRWVMRKDGKLLFSFRNSCAVSKPESNSRAGFCSAGAPLLSNPSVAHASILPRWFPPPIPFCTRMSLQALGWLPLLAPPPPAWSWSLSLN